MSPANTHTHTYIYTHKSNELSAGGRRFPASFLFRSFLDFFLWSERKFCVDWEDADRHWVQRAI